MKEKFIQDAFKELDPSKEQKERMYKSIIEKHESKDKKAIVVNHKKKILTTSVAVAACAALTICLGASIYNNAQNLNISRSANSTESTEETNSSAHESGAGTPSDVNEKITDTTAQSFDSFMSMIDQKYVNGKKYYIGEKNSQQKISYSNINLSDLTVTQTTKPDGYSPYGSCIYKNNLYSIINNDDFTSHVLSVSDVTTGETINKMSLDDYFNSVYTDNSGKIYLQSLTEIRVYSNDLELLYSTSIDKLNQEVNGNTEIDMYIGAMAVSPQGEIYIGTCNKENLTVDLFKLDSEYNAVFSREFEELGCSFSQLFIADDGNLVAYTEDYSDGSDTPAFLMGFSSQTGDIIGDYGRLQSGVAYGVHGNYVIVDDFVNQCVLRYDINSLETEKIFNYSDSNKTSVYNITLDGDNAIVGLIENEETLYPYCMYIEDSEGNIVKEIPLEKSMYNIDFDVTSDEKIYYTCSNIQMTDEENEDSSIYRSIYTLNDNYESVLLFEFPASYDDPSSIVLSVGSNDDFYICTTDINGNCTLNVYDHLGNTKSTLAIPSDIQYVSESILSDSELLLIGYNSEKDMPCSVYVDLNTMQPGEVRTIDNNAEVSSKNGSVVFSYYTDDETKEREEQKKAEEIYNDAAKEAEEQQMQESQKIEQEESTYIYKQSVTNSNN